MRMRAGMAVEPTRTHPEQVQLWSEIVTVARRLGDDALVATVLDARRHALWEPGGLDRQIAIAREILRRAQGARVPELEIRATADECIQRYWPSCRRNRNSAVNGARRS